jgi:2,4-dienoyl-CoA reductase-like NADH-dependent reductase (Old Yellow Enzyme family)
LTDLFEPLSLAHGPALKNRLALAPLTNLQSHPDGTLSDDEFKWLTYRAKGGFALTMTCAAHVQRIGQGFPGQLGVFGDEHLPGLTRLAAQIKAYGSIAVVQLHHAGMRSPKDLIGEAPVAPSDDEGTGARGLTTAEVEQLIEDFVAAAVRSEKAGFDGVELHGANGYLLDQFLQDKSNQRTDAYGGPIENRARLMLEAVDAAISVFGPGRVGLHLAPRGDAHDMGDSDLKATFTYVARAMRERGLAFLMARERQAEDSIGSVLKAEFGGVYIVNEGFTLETAQAAVASGAADAVGFGKLFISNPDLPARLKVGAPLNPWTVETFYSPGPEGYVDYPALETADA